MLTEDIEMEADDDKNADTSSPKQRALSSHLGIYTLFPNWIEAKIQIYLNPA